MRPSIILCISKILMLEFALIILNRIGVTSRPLFLNRQADFGGYIAMLMFRSICKIQKINSFEKFLDIARGINWVDWHIVSGGAVELSLEKKFYLKLLIYLLTIRVRSICGGREVLYFLKINKFYINWINMYRTDFWF